LKLKDVALIRFQIEDEREIVWNDMVRGQMSCWRQTAVIWSLLGHQLMALVSSLQLCSGGR